MKKAILLFLAALMCVSMLACSVANSGSETTHGLISDMPAKPHAKRLFDSFEEVAQIKAMLEWEEDELDRFLILNPDHKLNKAGRDWAEEWLEKHGNRRILYLMPESGYEMAGIYSYVAYSMRDIAYRFNDLDHSRNFFRTEVCPYTKVEQCHAAHTGKEPVEQFLIDGRQAYLYNADDIGEGLLELYLHDGDIHTHAHICIPSGGFDPVIVEMVTITTLNDIISSINTEE